MIWRGVIFFTCLTISWFLKMVHYSEACNQVVCASIISKCLLVGNCNCDLKACKCCKDCFTCLNYLYDECCSCIGMCPMPNVTNNALSKMSQVEDLSLPIPNLFEALTAEVDLQKRWTSFVYPVDFDIYLLDANRIKEIKNSIQNKEESEHPLKPNIITLNCTVAYMNDCISWNKCKESCQSMGATSIRWFQDSCCECVGNTCTEYGIDESRCTNCPLPPEEEEYEDYDENKDEEVEYKFNIKKIWIYS